MKNKILLILFFISTNIYAFVEFELDQVGPSFAIVSPKKVETTTSLGITSIIGSMSSNKFSLRASIDYWKQDSTARVIFEDIIFSSGVKYSFEPITKLNIVPFIGTDIAFHWLSADIKGQAPVESEIKMGLDLYGGTLYQLIEKLSLSAEVNYRIITEINQFTVKTSLLYSL